MPNVEDRVAGDTGSRGLAHSLRGLAASAVGLLHTRLSLLATELEEERLRMLQLVFWGAVALLFLSFGVVMLSFTVIILFWDTHRLPAALVLGAVYLGIGIGVVAAARRRMQRSRLFAASIDELAKDRDTLTPQ